jgi:hypothetical protein
VEIAPESLYVTSVAAKAGPDMRLAATALAARDDTARGMFIVS